MRFLHVFLSFSVAHFAAIYCCITDPSFFDRKNRTLIRYLDTHIFSRRFRSLKKVSLDKLKEAYFDKRKEETILTYWLGIREITVEQDEIRLKQTRMSYSAIEILRDLGANKKKQNQTMLKNHLKLSLLAYLFGGSKKKPFFYTEFMKNIFQRLWLGK